MEDILEANTNLKNFFKTNNQKELRVQFNLSLLLTMALTLFLVLLDNLLFYDVSVEYTGVDEELF